MQFLKNVTFAKQQYTKLATTRNEGEFDMVEIRLHGRGGQGAVVGCSIIGLAYFLGNQQVQFFPEFGVERRGAPVKAFLRISKSSIREHYSIKKPDHLIVFDESLLSTVNVTEGLKQGGHILINSKEAPDHFKIFDKFKVSTVDADLISIENNLGSANAPIINAAIAGAFARVIGNLNIKSVVQSIKQSVPAKIDENIIAAQTAYNNVILG